MANLIQFDGEKEVFKIKDAEGLSGALFHLATLEIGKKTYMALATHHPESKNYDLGIVIVREDCAEDGNKEFSMVSQEEELMEIIPKFFEAFMPDFEDELTSEAYFAEEDTLEELTVFDFSEDEDLLQ